MATKNPPITDIGSPDLAYGTWGMGLLSDWWETTADLIWPQSVVTYGRMRLRHDPQLRAVLQAFTLPIMRATWALDPEGCRDEVVQHVSDDLGMGIMGTDLVAGPARRRGVIWHRHLAMALNHLTYGFMPFERRYEIQPDGYCRLINLGQRMPWTVAQVKVGHDGVVQEIHQTTQSEPIPGSRLAWYVLNQEGSNWVGISILRAAFGAWLLKHESWRVHATSIRRFGMGVPVVEAPAGATQTQVQQARDMAGAMRVGDQSGIGIPQGFKPSLMGITGSTPDALGFIKYLDVSMAKMALAGLIELGQSDHGSRALGETFMDLFLLAVQGLADEMAVTATSGHPGMPGIVTDLVDQNWGTPDNPEPAPRIVCLDVGENYQVTAEALWHLTQTGAMSPDPALDEHVRKMWRIPKRSTEWEPTSRGVPASGEPAGPVAVPGEEGLPAPAAPPKDAPPKPPAKTPPANAAAGGLRRKLTAMEARAGFQPVQHQQDWESGLAQLVAAYRPVVSQQRTELVDAVIKAVKEQRKDRLALSPPELGDGPGVIAAHMQSVANQAAHVMASEAAGQGVHIDVPHVDPARLGQVATARASLAASALAQAASARAMQVRAAKPRKPPQEDIDLIAEEAGAEVAGYLDGLSDRSLLDQLGAALTAAQNDGRVAVLEAAPESAGQAVYVATEILDGNTCDACADEDGTEYESLDEAEAAYPGGGFVDCEGFARCRGTIVAVWGDVPG